MPAYLETNATTISAALRPVDTFTGGAPFGSLRIGLVESIQPPLPHPEGFVLFADLPAGDYTTRVNGQFFDHHPALSFDPAELDPVAGAVTLNLQPSPRYPFPAATTLVRGLVHDAADEPIAGVAVQVQSGGPVARTNAAGEFVFFFDYTVETEIIIDFAKPGFADTSETLNVTPETTVTVDVEMTAISDPETALLVCTVLDPDGEPVSGALVEAPDYSVSARSGLNGKALLPVEIATATEDVDVRVNADGFAEKLLTIASEQGETASFNANLTLASTPVPTALLVQIVDHENAELAGALVEIIEFGRAALTDATNGRARFFWNRILPHEGRVTVRVSKNGFVTKIRTLTLQVGKETTLGLKMTQSM